MFYVYVLYSESYDKTYTGFSSNLELRLLSHNEFSQKDWTKRYRPWRLVHSETFETRKEAMQREKYLKTGVGRDFIKSILNK